RHEPARGRARRAWNDQADPGRRRTARFADAGCPQRTRWRDRSVVSAVLSRPDAGRRRAGVARIALRRAHHRSGGKAMTDQSTAIAAEVLAAYDARRQIASFAERHPGFDLDGAYAVTAAVRHLRTARGERPI